MTVTNTNNDSDELDLKDNARRLMKSVETGDQEPIGYVDAETYTQHNLSIADGLDGFAKTLEQLPADSTSIDTVRLFRDGEYIFAHNDWNFFGPKIGFDILRAEDGKFVEHWDNLQETPDSPNPSGHTMLDGATEVTDLEKTEENKELVENFVTDILVNGRIEKLEEYIDGDTYIQHNPEIADGLSGLREWFEGIEEAGITMEYDEIHMVLAEGNFVLTVSEGEFGGDHTAFYDLFRVEDEKVVEHWDVIEEIPPRDEWANDNGKF